MLETYHPPRLGLGSRRALVGCALLVALLALPRSFGGIFCTKKIVKKFQLIWRTFISAQKTTPR